MTDRTVPADRRTRDLLASIALLAVVVTLALIGLATDRNWPKMLRVSLAFLAYATVLLGFLRWRGAPRDPQRALPFHWFGAAGAAAGVVSGIVRPEFHLSVLVAGTLGAAALLAGVHWLALRSWRAALPDRGTGR